MRLSLLLTSCSLATLLMAQDDQRRPTTELRFQEMEFDFGQVRQDSENTHVFKFKNTGSVPLIIESAAGSCGCTVPEYADTPIAPGAESEILVVYKPGKQEGEQHKTVTIIANTKPAQTILRIQATVLVDGVAPTPTAYLVDDGVHRSPPDTVIYTSLFPPDEGEDAPTDEPSTTLAPTRMTFEAMEHDFGDVLQGSENPYVFRFKNTGDAPLVISEARGSCGCTVPFYAKDPILPGEESEIHVVYKPGKQQGQQKKTVTLTANTESIQTLLHITANVLVVDSVTAPSLFVLEEEHQKEREAIGAVSPGCFVLFPNPASNELRLDLKEHIGRSADVRIHDETGRQMLQTRIASISSEASRLDISSFQAGIYIATIQVEDKAPMSQCFVVNE